MGEELPPKRDKSCLHVKNHAGTRTSWENWQGINLGWIVNISSFRAADALGSQVRGLYPAQTVHWQAWLWNSHFYSKQPLRDSSFTEDYLRQEFKSSNTCLCITLLAKPWKCVFMCESWWLGFSNSEGPFPVHTPTWSDNRDALWSHTDSQSCVVSWT